MKKSLITLALSIALSQAACATVAVPPPYQAGQKSQQSEDKPKTDKRQVFKGAGIGCASGRTCSRFISPECVTPNSMSSASLQVSVSSSRASATACPITPRAAAPGPPRST